VNPQLAIVSDECGPVQRPVAGLCWIHAERVLAKLVGFNDAPTQGLGHVRATVWQLYRDLKAYKVKPSAEANQALEARFTRVCDPDMRSFSLNLALKRMHRTA